MDQSPGFIIKTTRRRHLNIYLPSYTMLTRGQGIYPLYISQLKRTIGCASGEEFGMH